MVGVAWRCDESRILCAHVLHDAKFANVNSLKSQFSVSNHRKLILRNLVDPASSHMLVSKIKPCMSQYKLLYGETANGSLKQL